MESGDVLLSVSRDDAGLRLDHFAARRLQRSNAECKRWIAQGRIVVEGKRTSKGLIVEEGMVIRFSPPPSTLAAEPNAALEVVDETSRWVLVNKPAGLPTTARRPEETGTLVNALLGRYPSMRDVGYGALEPGLIHRLDTHTSGLVLAAKDGDAFRRLSRALRAGQFTKRYLAIVRCPSLPSEGVVETRLEPDPHNRRRVRVTEETRTPMRRTAYRVVRRSGELQLLEVTASRAYRHQVRAHLAHVGAPLVGDGVYGFPEPDLTSDRHALHAHHVAWDGDDELPRFTATLPLAADLEALLSGLGPSTSNTSRNS